MAGLANVDSPGGISGNGSVVVEEGGFSGGGTQTVGASTVSAPGAYGRVLFQLNLSGNADQPAVDVEGYIVNASRRRRINLGNADDRFVVIGPMEGVAPGLGANTGKFSAASAAGTSQAFGAEGEGQQGSLHPAGVVRPNAGGTVTGMLNRNDLSLSSPQSSLTVTDTYTADRTGRVTLTNLTDGGTFQYSMHRDLDGNGGGVVLSDDADDVFSGEAFRAASLSGDYGLNTSLYTTACGGEPAFGNAVGTVLSAADAGVDDVAGFADTNGVQADFAASGSFTPAAAGVFPATLTGFNAGAPATADTFTLYLADNTQGVAIETDDAQLTLIRLAPAR